MRQPFTSPWLALPSLRGAEIPAVVVPDLKQKFALVQAHTSRSWADLSVAFGKPLSSVKFWGHGSRDRAPDRLPAWALPILTALIAEMLPASRQADDLRDLVFGPAARLEEIVRSGASASLAAILATEARRDSATLIRRSGDISLVEVQDETVGGQPRLRLGEWFRIAFPRLRSGRYVAVLQNAQQAWAVLGTSPYEASQPILVPGGTADEPLFMHERRDLGRHRFVCLEAPAPFPAFVDEHRREGATLDKRGLDELAAFFKALPPSQRACQLLAVSVEARPGG